LSSSSHQPALETHLPEPAWPEPPLPAWKVELNAKLAAHRQRRPTSALPESESHTQQQRPGDSSARASDSSARAASVAARVAERYAKAPSYSEFLAASAAAAAAAAKTAAFATRQAQDAAEQFAQLSRDHAAAADASWQAAEAPSPSAATIEDPRPATVEHPQPLPARGLIPPRPSASAPSLFANTGGIVDAIAEATVPAAVSLPAKLIEFPRELVAPRKSRPRIAEGPLVEAPLFEQAEQANHTAQANPPALRIFEVEGAAMAGDQERSTPQNSAEREASRAADRSGSPDDPRHVAPQHQAAPEWQSIRLGEHPVNPLPNTGTDHEKPADQGSPHAQPVLYAAPIPDRAMAALVDTAVVGLAFVLFVLVFAACTTHPPLDRAALVCGGVVLGGLFLFYQWLFMSFGGGTLGMRYAQIAVCTFDEENPTRHTMRRRVGASVLCLLPLGLGFLWALFDEDSLGWHDRMTRSYQRSYR
jgi:uncharacterized RDD family membrane protein YckC